MQLRQKHSLYPVLAIVAAAVSACGGGGGAGGGTGAPPATVQVSAGADVAIDSSSGLTVQGSATSTKVALAQMVWSAQAVDPNSPALVLANDKCQTASKSDTPGTNAGGQSYTTSNWACGLGVKAPQLKQDAVYLLTLNASDSSGASATSTARLTVRAASTVPSGQVHVDAGQPVQVVSGTVQSINCLASGGNAPTGYQFQWVQIDAPDTTLSLANKNSQQSQFTAPAVAAPVTVQLECRATDDAMVTGTAIKKITVVPGDKDLTLVASAGQPSQVVPGSTVTLDGSASAWFNAAGAKTAGAMLHYSWSQVAGPAVQIANPTVQSPTFAVPSTLDKPTDYQFKLTVTSDSGAKSEASVTVTSNPASALNLSLLQSSRAVGKGDAVQLYAVTAPSAQGKTYFSWTQISGPSVPLGGGATSTAGFVVPTDATIGTTYVFRVSAGFSPISGTYLGIQSVDQVVMVVK